jgi:ABC-2 type transport system ATP-binding protein
MADIQELCERVIIIDHGKIFFDGKLIGIVDRFADFKLVTIAITIDIGTYGDRLWA